jgi:hypothetical protein
MLNYTPRQLAALLHISPRQVTDLCVQGRFVGAHKDARGHWKIPQDVALAAMAERSSEVELLPPEGLAVAPRETAESFVLGIVAKEMERRSAEVSEMEKRIALLEERLEEMAKKKPSLWARLWGKG